MNIKRTIASVFGANIFTSILSLGSIVYFSRIIGIGSLGSYFLFVSVIGTIGFLANFGLPSAVEKRISEKENPEGILTTALLIESLFVTPFLVGIILLSNQINAYLGSEVAMVLAVTLLMQQIGALLRNALEGELKVSSGAWFQSLQKFTWFLFGAIAISVGDISNPLILSHLVSILVMIFAIVIAIDTGLGKPKIHHGKSLLNFSKYSLLGAAGGKLYNWGDVLILGFFVSSSAIGAYEIAWRVSQSMMLLAQSIRRTIYPRISAWDAEGKQHRIRELISDAILPSTYLSIPAFFGVILYSEQILVFIFDSGAGMASMALTVLMFEKIVRSLHMTISPAIMALDRPDLIVFPVAVISITNITLNIPLIWKFGITGAAVGTSTASIVGAMIYINNLNKLITIQMPWKELVWCTISSIVMFLLLSLINEFIFVDDLVGLIIFICLGALIYFVTTLTFRPIRVYILENLPSIGYGPGSHP